MTEEEKKEAPLAQEDEQADAVAEEDAKATRSLGV